MIVSEGAKLKKDSKGKTIGLRVGQFEKATRFRALHEGSEPLVVGNPFDAGSARILERLGFLALATSSGGFAGTIGRRDGNVSRDDALRHAQAIVDAVELPVSADLENGFGHDPATVAETVRMAAEVGLVGCSIEDATGESGFPIHDIKCATARVRAAVASARSTGFDFILTARCECFLRGQPELEAVIIRLRAYEAAGADVLMAPGLPDLEAVKAVCAAVSRPVNFMAGIPQRSFSVSELAKAGVRRISLAGSLHRAAMSGVIDAASEVLEIGTFGYVETVIPTRELSEFMRR